MTTGIFLTAALLLSGGLFFNRNKVVNYSFLVIYLCLLWFFSISQLNGINRVQHDFFTPDALGVLLLLTISVVSIPALWHGYKYMITHDETLKSRGLFFAAMIMLISACSVAYIANHIAVIWIFTEITTLSASALIYHHRNIRALEGVWKYVFLCAISITFIYIGILFLSLAVKDAGVDDLSFDSLYANASRLNPFWLKFAFLFIFAGFTAKLGLVPMYTAGIDAKDKAPAPAGALLASVLMNVGFVGIYRLYAVLARTPLWSWAGTVMIVAAMLSVFVAAVYMTRIKNLKRLFAYSGIEHMGLVVLGLAAGGIGIYAAILHIVLHSLVKPSLFFQFSQIYRVYQSKSIYDTGNYLKYNKSGAFLVLLGFFSAIAMPPSGLFVSEFMIFQSMFEAHRILVLTVVVLLLTLIIWGFGSNIFKLLFIPPVRIDEKQIPRISPWESFPQYLLLALAVYLAYAPPALLVTLIRDAAKLIS